MLRATVGRAAALALVTALAGCGAKIMEEEVKPRLDAGVGLSTADMALRLGQPTGGTAAAPTWTDGYKRATREPVRQYINGTWVTVYHRTVYTDVRCTITATIVDDTVTHLAAQGAASVCRGLASKIVGY